LSQQISEISAQIKETPDNIVLWKQYLLKIQETAELDKRPEYALKELETAKCGLPEIQAEIEALMITARMAIPA
jgi:hypothetical protein